MKRWWQKKKVWGTIIAVLLRVYGSRFGIDPEAASAGALILMGGVSAEGIIDAASAFGRAWKGTP